MLLEKQGISISGWGMIIAMMALGIASLSIGEISILSGSLVSLCGVLSFGFFAQDPNEARILLFFGSYAGTVRESGLRWSFPFYTRIRVSLRVRNFESSKMKVNDANGNPIEIASVVVWKVVDSAQAYFEVAQLEEFVKIQAESAIRNLAMRYPYDAHDGSHLSLLGSPREVMEQLKREVQERLDKYGVQILDARISHLAYSSEIAAAMLQRQQAAAVVAARQIIVEGAVGMVESALHMLSKNQIVDLDEERKASMVSNLLVVLCSERSSQPIINAGSIY